MRRDGTGQFLKIISVSGCGLDNPLADVFLDTSSIDSCYILDHSERTAPYSVNVKTRTEETDGNGTVTSSQRSHRYEFRWIVSRVD